jgi:hypothetical protein
MPGRCSVCSSCGVRVELGQGELPCEVLRGWFIVSQLRGSESIERHSFCSISCLKKWAETESPQVPEIFIRSLDEEDQK